MNVLGGAGGGALGDKGLRFWRVAEGDSSGGGGGGGVLSSVWFGVKS